MDRWVPGFASKQAYMYFASHHHDVFCLKVFIVAVVYIYIFMRTLVLLMVRLMVTSILTLILDIDVHA